MSQRKAALYLGVSVPFFREHILPNIKVARVGQRTLIPTAELNRWFESELHEL